MRPSPAAPVQLVRFTASPPSRTSLVATNQNDPDVVISPDGTRIVYVAGDEIGGGQQRLYMRALDQLEARLLEGLEDPRTPFLSPDGRWVGIFGEPNVLKKVTVNGGPSVTICKISGGPRGASWGPDLSANMMRGSQKHKAPFCGGSATTTLAISAPSVRSASSPSEPIRPRV